MWREVRTAVFKSHDAARAIGYGRALQMMAASASLASAYLNVPLGNLQPGSAADIVVTRYLPATPLSDDNIASHLVFGLGPEYVRHVLIGGNWCVRDGIVTSCDEHQIRASAVETSRRLYSRME